MRITALVALLVLALTVTACAPADTNPSGKGQEQVVIGLMLPLSGDVAPYGNGVKSGIDQALAEAGNPANVRFVIEDSKCAAKDAVSAINKLISVDKVDVIIGEVCSGATLAAAPIATQNSVVMVSPTSSSPKLTQESWVFRTIPSDSLQGDVAANLIYDDGYRNIAILWGNEDYGAGIEEVLSKSFKGLGGTVVASESFVVGATDLRTQVTKIKQKDPDAIYIVVNSLDSAAAAIKQVRDLGMDVPIYGSEGLRSLDMVKAAGDAAEGLTVTSVSQGTKAFQDAVTERTGTALGPFAAQGHDAMQSVLVAISNGARTGVDFRQELLKEEFDGVTGHIDFDEHGDIQGNYAIEVVHDGEFETR